MRSALYTYTTPNIGDDFQSYVMAGIVGQPEVWIDRDRASSYTGEPCRLIANAYMTGAAFPIPASVRAELVAIHLEGTGKPMETSRLEYLRRNAAENGPIGCRDLETFRYLERLRVACYFAGCPSVLCWADPEAKPADFILFVDVDPSMFGRLNRQPHVRWLTQQTVERTTSARQKLCRTRHRLFTAARLVVTSRIHVALPCLGMGKPVIFVNQNIKAASRLGALPSGFKKYEAWSKEVWNMEMRPDLHLFDVSEYRLHVRNHLYKRLGIGADGKVEPRVNPASAGVPAGSTPAGQDACAPSVRISRESDKIDLGTDKRVPYFWGGIGDVFMQCCTSDRYRILSNPDPPAIVVNTARNEYLNEFFRWHPNAERFRVIRQRPPRGMEGKDPEFFRLLGLPPESLYVGKNSIDWDTKFYPSPNDAPGLAWVKGQRYGLYAAFSKENKTIPEAFSLELLPALKAWAAGNERQIFGIGRNYKALNRRAQDFGPFAREGWLTDLVPHGFSIPASVSVRSSAVGVSGSFDLGS
jgi:hypothetical protein